MTTINQPYLNLLKLEDLQLKHKQECFNKAKQEKVKTGLDNYELGALYQSGAESTAPVLCTCCNNLIPEKDLEHTYRPTMIDDEDVEPVSLCKNCGTERDLIFGYNNIYNKLIEVI